MSSDKKLPSGIDLARQAGSTAHADLLEAFKEQLLIVFLKRVADDKGRFVIPVSEVDDTGQDLLSFSIVEDPFIGYKEFHFQLSKKD